LIKPRRITRNEEMIWRFNIIFVPVHMWMCPVCKYSIVVDFSIVSEQF